MDLPASSTSQALNSGLILSHAPLDKSFADLPLEILTSILFLAVEPFNFEHFQRHQTLASVCRQWRDVIIRTPQFWVYIKHPEGLSRSLRLSRTAPLYVEPVNRDEFNGATVRFTDEEFQAVLDCCERWRSLNIDMSDPRRMERVRAAFKQDLPLLEDVYISDRVRSSSLSPLILHNAPHLRSLSTSYMFPDINFSPLSLRAINIIYPPIQHLTIPALHNLLVACPNLRSFEVHGIHGRKDHPQNTQPAETPNQTSTITLPHLEELSIGDLPPSLALSFLQSLHTPSLALFSFDWYPVVHIEQSTLRKDNVIPRFFATMLKNKPPNLISLQLDNKNICVEVDDQPVLHFWDQNRQNMQTRAPGTELLRDIIDMFDMGKYPVELLWRVRNNVMPLIKELATLPADTARIVTLVPVFRKSWHFDMFFKLFTSLRDSAGPKPIFPAAERMDMELHMDKDWPAIGGRVGRMLQQFNRPASKPLNVYFGPQVVFNEKKGTFVPVSGQSGSTLPPDNERVTRFLRCRDGSGSTSSKSGSDEEPDFMSGSHLDSDSDPTEDIYKSAGYYSSDDGF